MSAVAARHEKALLYVARQFSLCDDDALDAYQRALEIFVRRVETVDPKTEVAWLKVVVRHEAMAIRRSRSESVTGEELDLDAFVPGPDRAVEEQIASGERVRRSAEALRALKPDEAEALMLRAHGLTYQEIGERNGWTFTKVNRAVTEGRRRFMRAYAGIEAGDECERFGPIVEALARGDASSRQVLEIRPHLRHCTACRATVRDLHLSRLRRASLLWPAIGVTADRDIPSLETVLEIEPPPPEPSWLTSLLHRLQASDAATGLHLAMSGGGGRISALAAAVAFCLSGLTAGTVCVVTGVLPDPLRGLDADAPRLVDRPPFADRRPRRAPRAVVRQIEATRLPAPTATPARTSTSTSTGRSEPVRRGSPARTERRESSSSRDRSQGTAPASHEYEPISPAPETASVSAETFSPEAPPSPPEAAPAPATGGGEFTP